MTDSNHQIPNEETAGWLWPDYEDTHRQSGIPENVASELGRAPEPSPRPTNPDSSIQPAASVLAARNKRVRHVLSGDDTLDIRSLEYVAKVDSNLLCPICHSPFDKPVRLLCDHVFCHDCLQQSFNSRSSVDKTCPSCRTVIDTKSEWRLPVPRMVTQMLDELVVKCPNDRCGEEKSREEIELHVNSYCQYALVPCPAIDCCEDIAKKDAGGECLHRTIPCTHCDEEISLKDHDSHLTSYCAGYLIQCKDCDAEFLKRDLTQHQLICPLATTECRGSAYSCAWTGLRSELERHQSSCAIASLTPFLSAQQENISKQAAEISRLKRQNNLQEASISALQSILYAKPTSSDPHATVPTIHQSSSSNPDTEPTPLDLVPPQNSATTEPPFDTPTSHLLYLHESLRSELSRLETALGEVDARGSMMLMNESLRMREDLAQMNSAVNTMRTQLHYLMSAELQRRAAMQGSLRGGGGVGGPGGSGADGGGLRNAAMGGMGLRRGPGEGRQDTKL